MNIKIRHLVVGVIWSLALVVLSPCLWGIACHVWWFMTDDFPTYQTRFMSEKQKAALKAMQEHEDREVKMGYPRCSLSRAECLHLWREKERQEKLQQQKQDLRSISSK